MLISSRMVIVMTIAFAASGWTLFHNPSLTGLLEGDAQRVEWYGVFASQIFHPYQTYISESVLLPLIAKVLGASTSRSSWLVLCSIVTFLVMPVLTAIAIFQTNSTRKGLLFLLAIASLLNLQDLPLGFPDPMTIMMLGIVAMQNRIIPLFVAAFFASISHFSLSLFSLFGLGVLIRCDVRSGLTVNDKKYRIYGLLLGALAGKIFVAVWHLLLNYHAESRLQWALNYGLQEFWARYAQDPLAFWLTPGIGFLIVYGFILCVLAWCRNLQLAIAGFVVLFIAYAANYLALDGVRIFTTAASAPLVYLALRVVDSVAVSKSTVTKLSSRFNSAVKEVRYLHRLSFAGLISMIWLYVLSAAQWAGFGINFLSGAYLTSQHIYWGYFFLAFSFFIIAIFAQHLNRIVLRAAKTVYIGLIMVIVTQWVRGSWCPDAVIVGWIKFALLIFLGLTAHYLASLVDYKNATRLFVLVRRPIQRILRKFLL
jgi:hypothetical protein